MLDLWIVLWDRFVKKHFATPGLVFVLMWVGIILVILALSGFAHWFFLYSSSGDSVTKAGNETGISLLGTPTQPGTVTVTSVSVPSASPVTVTPSPSTLPSPVTTHLVPDNPNTYPSITNGTSSEHAGQQSTPIVTATVMVSRTALPTAEPTPVSTATPVSMPTPGLTAIPVSTATPIPKPTLAP